MMASMPAAKQDSMSTTSIPCATTNHFGRLCATILPTMKVSSGLAAHGLEVSAIRSIGVAMLLPTK